MIYLGPANGVASTIEVGYTVASSRDERDLYRAIRQAGMFMSIPMLLVAGPLVGYFLGRLLDEKVQTAPWGLVGGLMIGLAASVRETIRLIRRAIQDTNDGS